LRARPRALPDQAAPRWRQGALWTPAPGRGGGRGRIAARARRGCGGRPPAGRLAAPAAGGGRAADGGAGGAGHECEIRRPGGRRVGGRGQPAAPQAHAEHDAGRAQPADAHAACAPPHPHPAAPGAALRRTLARLQQRPATAHALAPSPFTACFGQSAGQGGLRYGTWDATASAHCRLRRPAVSGMRMSGAAAERDGGFMGRRPVSARAHASPIHRAASNLPGLCRERSAGGPEALRAGAPGPGGRPGMGQRAAHRVVRPLPRPGQPARVRAAAHLQHVARARRRPVGAAPRPAAFVC